MLTWLGNASASRGQHQCEKSRPLRGQRSWPITLSDTIKDKICRHKVGREALVVRLAGQRKFVSKYLPCAKQTLLEFPVENS